MHCRRLGSIAVLFLCVAAMIPSAAAALGEVTNLLWCAGPKSCLQWSPVGGANQYLVYRGEWASLPCILNPTIDSCDHGAVVTTTTGTTIPENPAAGRFFWFVVTAADGSGEGTPGAATSGPRSVEDTGACLPACAPSGSSCSVGGDCCSSHCFAGTCDSACCHANGGVCLTNGDCCSGICSGGLCVAPCVQNGEFCVQNADCCSNACLGNACVQCIMASQCPGPDNACQTRTCTGGSCGFSFATPGTPAGNQTAGDCQTVVCDGAGGTTTVQDNNDVPADDGNQCTSEACTGGIPSHPIRPINFPCAQDGGVVCSANGTCVECNTTSQCPGTDTECQTRSCTGGACGFSFAPNGTPTGSQSPGDCHENRCDGAGGTVNAIDNADVPVDGNQCTSDACNGGVPSNPPVPLNSPCSQGGGVVCSGTGTCVQCNSASQCPPGFDTQCQSRTCSANACGVSFAPVGTSCNEDGGTVCDGAGSCVVAPTVVATAPADGASANAGTAISVTFDQAMNPATLTGQTSDGACGGSIQVSLDSFSSCVAFSAAAATMSGGNTVATFQPAPGLLVNRTFRIRVTTAAQNAANIPLTSTYTHATGFTTVAPNLCDGAVVISQVYGAGGLAGASQRNDFVELHNRGSVAVSLAGKSIQYASAAGTTWLNQVNLTGTIAAGGYYLIQLASDGTQGTVLPAPDQTGTVNMSGTSGKVAYVANTTPLSGGCPLGANVLDFVGYGAAATCSEGGANTANASNTTAPTRRQAGCQDLNVNGSDFTVMTPAPRNTASPAVTCACVARNESNVTLEADYCAIQFPASMAAQVSTTTSSVFGQIFEAGVTEPAGASTSVLSQLGYGPPSANPEYQPGWSWFSTSYNLQVGNNDEYQGQFTAPAAPGSYRYTYRFSLDQGVSWTYCDTNGAGSNVGITFELGDLGVLTVTP